MFRYILFAGVSSVALASSLLAPSAHAACHGNLADGYKVGSDYIIEAGCTISGRNNSNSTGIFNNSAIGSIKNAGVISGGIDGIANYVGAIGLISNSGTISGGWTGILNDATIELISNSGLIAGGRMAALSNNGSIGSIVNAGTIAGNIIDTSGNNLVISGGSGSTFGTLTGGTITARNFTLGEGNQFLDEDVKATAFTNNASILRINRLINVTGDYVAIKDNNHLQISSAGRLAVTGKAMVTNQIIDLQGTWSVGSYTLITGGSGSSYSDITLSNSSVTWTQNSNDLVLTVSQAITDRVDPDNPDKPVDPNAPSSGSSNKRPPSLATKHLSSTVNLRGAMDEITRHLDSVTRGGSAPAGGSNSLKMGLAGLPLGLDGQIDSSQLAQGFGLLAQGSTGETKRQPWEGVSVWLSPFAGKLNQSGHNGQAGYSDKYYGVVGGVDKALNDNVTAGVAVSWNRSWQSDNDSAADTGLKSDSYQGFAYSGYRKQSFYANVMGGGSYDKYEQSLGSGSGRANYSGYQFFGKGEVGYDFALRHNVVVTPLTDLVGSYGQVDQHAEGDGVTADKTSVPNLVQGAGVKVGYSKLAPIGLISVTAKGQGLYNWLNSDVTQNLRSTDGSSVYSTSSRQHYGARAAVGASLRMKHELTAGASYEATFMFPGYVDQSVMLKLEKKF